MPEYPAGVPRPSPSSGPPKKTEGIGLAGIGVALFVFFVQAVVQLAASRGYKLSDLEFDLLLVACAFGFVLAVGMIAYGFGFFRFVGRLGRRLGNRDNRLPQTPASQIEESSELAPIMPDANAEDGDLTVWWDREEWHPFKFKALILQVRVNVRNNTDHRKALTEVEVRSDRWPPVAQRDAEVDQEVGRLEMYRATRLPGVVDQEETVSYWLFRAFAHNPQGGRPTYAVIVRDNLVSLIRVLRSIGVFLC